jgi:hypothetical protein
MVFGNGTQEECMSENPSVEELESREVRERDDVSPEDALGVFALVDGPSITTRDLKLRLGCSSDRARELLEELRDEGKVRRRRVSGMYLYWLADPEMAVSPPDFSTPRADE